jgi:hypothetical protein
MRFINLFENFSDKYKRTNRFDENSLRKIGLVSISYKEVLKINEVLESKDYFRKVNLSYKPDTTGLNMYSEDYYLGCIYKTDDEWYYVYINWNYYKCDQLDGLLELLEKEL